jgi:hypothetical protein
MFVGGLSVEVLNFINYASCKNKGDAGFGNPPFFARLTAPI